MLTKKQILDQLSKEGIALGRSNPRRTFDFYRQIGLIPKDAIVKIKEKGKFKTLYPNWTPQLIKNIKKCQQEGEKLSEIKKAFRQSQQLLQNWAKVCKVKIGYMGMQRHSTLGKNLIIWFYSDRIEIYETDRVFDDVKKCKILGKQSLSLEEYKELVGKEAVRIASEKRRIITTANICEAISNK